MKKRLPGPLRVLLALFPRDFRRLHHTGLVADYSGPDAGSGWIARAWYWTRASVDVSMALSGVWWDRLRAGRTGAGDGAAARASDTAGSLIADIRYAFRRLRKTPAFTATAVVTIALGLGANAAIFSVVNGVLIRPLPYEEPSELVRVWSRFLPESGFDFPYFSVDPTEYLDLRDANRSFESVAAYTTSPATLTGDGQDADRRTGLRTTSNLFELLGVEAAIGRTFVAEDDVADGPNVVVLTHALWQKHASAKSRASSGP